jgi:phosphoserine phosphatase RsbU/P
MKHTMMDVSQDWMQACLVQERLMRAPLRASVQDCDQGSGRLDFGVRCRQLRALGGDCYDVSWTAGGELAFLIGDASGKGVAAALMMAGVQASLRTASLYTGKNLRALLRAANLQVCFSSLAERYATLFCGVLDPAAGTLRYVNAGHPAPLVLRADGAVEELEPTGPPVGLFPNAAWQEKVVRLRAGDRIVAYTDGVTEASCPGGEEWGVDGLAGAALRCDGASAEGWVQSILREMDEFSCGVPTDDATLAVLRVLG